MQCQNPKGLREQKRKEAEREAARGTFGDLMTAYIDHMRETGKTSWKHPQGALKRHVREPFKRLADSPASEISPSDISQILSRMINKKITVQTNRVRSYLHACFQFGLHSEFNPRVKSDKRFCLVGNPVSAIPTQPDFEKAGDRVLSKQEIKALWEKVDEATIPIVARLIKLCLLTGQRVSELRRLKWESVDFEQNAITIPAEIQKKRRIHVVPLGPLAIQTLNELREITGKNMHLFESPSMIGGPIRADSVSTRVTRMKIKGVEKFNLMDMRRTWKTHAGAAGLSKDIRDRIQAHLSQDVSTKHYDRHDYWIEKRMAMDKWELYFNGIIEGACAQNVLSIAR